MSKSSTKVLAPPGGKTSINVFSSEAEIDCRPINKCQAERSKSSVFAAYDNIHEEEADASEREVRRQLESTQLHREEEKAIHDFSNGHDKNGHLESQEEDNSSMEYIKKEDVVLDDAGLDDFKEKGHSPFQNNMQEYSQLPSRPLSRCQVERNKSSVFATEDEEEPKFQRKISPPFQGPSPENRPKTATRVLSPPGGVSSISLFGDDASNCPGVGSSDPNNNKGGKRVEYRSSTFDHVFGGGAESEGTSNRRRAYAPRSGNSIIG